jgi:hypothetical protein
MAVHVVPKRDPIELHFQREDGGVDVYTLSRPTMGEVIAEVSREKDKPKQTLLTVWIAMRKNHPDLKREEVERMFTISDSDVLRALIDDLCPNGETGVTESSISD